MAKKNYAFLTPIERPKGVLMKLGIESLGVAVMELSPRSLWDMCE
jgi:hypothetical protein